MLDETKSTLMNYRLEQARECLDSALLEIESGSLKAAANRLYYCVFHAMRAVLATEGFDSKKHSGIISAFQQKYIKTAVFPPIFSKIVQNLFSMRGSSDYEDFFVISKSDIIGQVENVKVFLSMIAEYAKTL